MLSSLSSSAFGMRYKQASGVPLPPSDPQTEFQYSINGTHYTGTANEYPITFNPLDENDTYATITNINKAYWVDNSFTIYVKGKYNIATALQGLFILSADTFSSGSNYISFHKRGSTSLHQAFTYKEGTTSITGNNVSMLASATDFIHCFITFDTVNVAFHFYSSISGALIYKSTDAAYTTATMFQYMDTYTMGHVLNHATNCGNVTIDIARWYNTAKTPAQMVTIVAADLN